MRKPEKLYLLLLLSTLWIPAAHICAQQPDAFKTHMQKIADTYRNAQYLSVEVETTFFRGDELQKDATQQLSVVSWGNKTYTRTDQLECLGNELFTATVNHKTQTLIIEPPRNLKVYEKNLLLAYINDTTRAGIRNLKFRQMSPEQWCYEMDMTLSRYQHIRIFFNPQKWTVEHVELDFSDMLTGEPCSLHIRYFNQQTDGKTDEALFRSERFLLQPPAKPVRKKKEKNTLPLYPAPAFKDYTFINHFN